MRLEFQDWINTQNISFTAKDIFQEAISCYKASAYRAALLLSYIGFQTIVRERILSSGRPAGISESLWNNVTGGLSDDDQWDSSVFDAIQRKSPAPIFDLSDDLRHQVQYWKNRRNDCAHSKRNEINYAHIEAFWLFIQSNLGKFVVRGSKESLLNEIRSHFDRSVTPAGRDYSHIISQIPNAIDPDDLSEFFNDTLGIFESSFISPLGEGEDFFNRILEIEEPIIIEELTEFLRAKEDFLLRLLRRHPDKLILFKNDDRFVRELWYAKLFEDGRIDYPLYCSLLRNGLIPDDQLEEAHHRTIKKLPDVLPKEECFYILTETGFFEVFRKLVFLGTDSSAPLADNFGWANSHPDLVAFYLQSFDIDLDVAKSLFLIFSKSNYPFGLGSRIDSFFRGNAEKRQEMLTALEELQVGIPEYLHSLSDEEDLEEVDWDWEEAD